MPTACLQLLGRPHVQLTLALDAQQLLVVRYEDIQPKQIA